MIYSDGFASYDGLVDVGYDKYFRVDHGNNECACGHRHSNGIEGFWGVAKTPLIKFPGMSKATLYLHLKEVRISQQQPTSEPVRYPATMHEK